MLKIYYDNTSDYKNSNRFYDQLEGRNDAQYNSFVSATSVDFYFKINNRLDTLKLDMPNLVPLSVSAKSLVPNKTKSEKSENTKTEITYFNNGLLTQPTITTI